MNEPCILECKSLSKKFYDSQAVLQILDSIDLKVYQGQKIGILGSSGSGKTTLLQLLAGLDRPDYGNVFLRGQNMFDLTNQSLNQLRNKHLGFVYQFHHLLPEFSALENVAMPLLMRKTMSLIEIKDQAKDLLNQVGLIHRKDHKPGELSGGERQRVAIARALVGKPDLVFMDEPTGNLDPETAEKVQKIMSDLAKKLITSFIVVTHDLKLAQNMDNIYRLESAKLDPVKNIK